ncbi:MAG TPA: uroporphyrinogen-III synthase [Gemmatimonadales bacterium]|nr:uroporphyrinogen-III synthase [Gemmatimonadales bacterium]
MATTAGPLAGRRIVVTRARDQAADLVRALEARGAVVTALPVIEIVPLPDLSALRAALYAIRDYQWVVFTSQNAVQVVCDRLEEWGLAPAPFSSARVGAIGPATAAALGERGIRVDLVPEGFIAESLVEALKERGGLAGARVLVPRAETARDALPDGLRALGARVDVIPVYRTVGAAGDGGAAAGDLLARRVDVVTFTSSSTVRHFVQLVGNDAARAPFLAAVIGPVTAETARSYGMNVAIAADEYTVPGLVSAIERHFAGGR